MALKFRILDIFYFFWKDIGVLTIFISEEMEFRMAKGEVLLRVSAILFLVSTACIVAFDTETKVVILMIKKKATYKDLDALK